MANLGMTPEQKQFIDWQQGQYNPTGGGTIGAASADPYNEANIRMAQEQLDTAASRVAARTSAGAAQDDANVQPWKLGSSPQASSQAPSSNLGFSSAPAPVMQSYTPNPYLGQMAQSITQQVGDNWSRNMAPSIRSGAMEAGGFGGSRQGVVEANGMKDANQGLSNSLASLYGNDYNAAMGRNLQQYGQDQSYALGNKQANNSYDLGLRSSDLGFSSLDANINNSNFNNQLNSANFGLGVYNTQQAGNNSAINAGSVINSTPYNNWQNFNQQANSIGQGYGSSTSNGSTSSPGSAAVGALGGWQLSSAFNKAQTPSVNSSLGFGPTTGGYGAQSGGFNTGEGPMYS